MVWLERTAGTGNPCWPFFKLEAANPKGLGL
jgi:hypothetical protein